MATPYLVGTAQSAANSNQLVLTVGSAGGSGTTAGDAIVVTAGNSGATAVTGVTDSKSNTYTEKPSTTSQVNQSMWVADSSNNGSGTAALSASGDTITLTYGATNTNSKTAVAGGVTGYSGTDVTPTPTSNAGSTGPSITSGTLAQASEVLFISFGNGNGGGTPSGLTNCTSLGTASGSSAEFLTLAYHVVAATTSVTTSCTIVSSKWSALLLSLEGISVAGAAALAGGAGTLTAGSTLTFAGAAALSGGAGTLTAGSTLTFAGAAALTGGAGVLTAAGGAPAPVIAGTWTASRAIGNGSGVPAPPTMPLACPVANSGDAGNGLVALVSWTLPAGYLGADMAVTDDAHNVWWPLGAPQASSPATGFSRSAIWAAPGAFAAQNVFVSPCGLPSPCYPAVIGVTVIEVESMSPYLGTPAVVTAALNAGTVVAANCALPAGSALMVAVGASDGTVSPTGPGAGWTALSGVAASGGGYHLNTAPAWQASAGSQSAAWSVASAADLSAASAVILLANTAPSQPSANWPAVQFLGGFGAGALTPPGQIPWTDLSQRWLAGAETSGQTGKQYELDQLQAGENVATFDDDDGTLTAGNPSSSLYPLVNADVPLRLIAWWDSRTYGVLAGFAERWPVSWDETWFGLTECTLPDVWSLQQNQLTSVLREETAWDPNLYAFWPCSDPAGSQNAQNVAPGNTSALQVVTSKNGALTAVQSFGNDAGALPGDQSGSFWQQGGLTTGAEGYGYALYCADPDYPLISSGLTIGGWFNPTGGAPAAQIDNQAAIGGIATLILIRASNAAGGPAFQLGLEVATGTHPGALVMTVWDVSTKVATATRVDTGDWLTAGFIRVSVQATQGTWKVFLNGQATGSGSCNLPSSMTWTEYMGSADRQYTGSMLNGECGDITIFGVLLPADREQALYLSGAPSPQTVAGGALATVTGAQFSGDYPATRIERLLAYGGWTGPRSVSQSSVTQMAPVTDIQGDTAVISASGGVTVSSGGQQAGEAASNIVFSDGGFLFADGNGTLCYVSRGDLYVTPSQWTLGEDTGSGEIPYLPSAVLGFDKSLLYNGAQLTPSVSSSGAPVVASNPSSIAAHGEYVYNATAYQLDVNQIADEASWIVNTRGQVTLRAEQITADAMANPDVWPFLLGVQPAQPVTVWRRPQTASYTVEVFPVTCGVTKELDFQAGTATAKITTDEFPEGTVIIIDDPLRSIVAGVNILGW